MEDPLLQRMSAFAQTLLLFRGQGLDESLPALMCRFADFTEEVVSEMKTELIPSGNSKYSATCWAAIARDLAQRIMDTYPRWDDPVWADLVKEGETYE